MIGGRRRVPSAASLTLAVLLVSPPVVNAGQVRRPDASAPPSTSINPPPVDDLYRRKGYGTGGLMFGGGQGGTAQAGACADLAFADPPRCGARGGYGIYGNGLGYGFGL